MTDITAESRAARVGRFLADNPLIPLVVLLLLLMGVLEYLRPGIVNERWMANTVKFAIPLAMLAGLQRGTTLGGEVSRLIQPLFAAPGPASVWGRRPASVEKRLIPRGTTQRLARSGKRSSTPASVSSSTPSSRSGLSVTTSSLSMPNWLIALAS